MNTLNSVIEKVYSYLNSLTLNDKIRVLSTFTRLPIAEFEGQYTVNGVSRDEKFIKDYIEHHVHWLRMSEIDNIHNFITEDK
jgi:hypothetical protein